MKLGQGAFGTVVADGKYAVKTFKSLNPLINEVFVTRYISGDPSVIALKKRDLSKLTMTTERWNCSLSSVIRDNSLTHVQKKSIHICILKGLDYLENRHIVHADIKPSNILINESRTRAVLADFGVSSKSNTARVGCTSISHCPKVAIKHRTHDGHALVIVTLQLLYGYTIGKHLMTKAELRSVVNTYVGNKIAKTALCSLIQDNPLKCANVSSVLYSMYGIKTEYKLPVVKIYSLADDTIDSCIRMHIDNLYKSYWFRKPARCYDCCKSMISRLPHEKCKLYTTTMAYIFSCVFGCNSSIAKDKRMSEIDVMKYCLCTKEELLSAINTILETKDIINLMFSN